MPKFGSGLDMEPPAGIFRREEGKVMKKQPVLPLRQNRLKARGIKTIV
jgi:hypothetical protein